MNSLNSARIYRPVNNGVFRTGLTAKDLQMKSAVASSPASPKAKDKNPEKKTQSKLVEERYIWSQAPAEIKQVVTQFCVNASLRGASLVPSVVITALERTSWKKVLLDEEEWQMCQVVYAQADTFAFRLISSKGRSISLVCTRCDLVGAINFQSS